MSSEKGNPPPARRVITEPRAKYTILDNNQVYNFEFPAQSSPMQNYDILSFLREELWKAIENQKKKEGENQPEKGEEKKCQEGHKK